MPYGIKIGPEVFQKYNERNFEDIPNVVVFIDDILIAADTIDEHDRILKKVLERTRKLNIKFNIDKIQYKVTEVKYLGKIISCEGIRSDPERIKAITQIDNPKTKKDLQKLLGMINYIQDYVLSEISKPLRDLLKNNVVFNWQKHHENCLNQIKSIISNTLTLTIFDESKEITIETDASKFGIGCCLMQNGKPVSFASRSLSDAEVNYAQIEKEFLAVVFACRKFHYYIYGRSVTVRTDHKPLIEIMKKEFCKIPSARLQRMKLSLLKYNLKLIYIPGKFLYVADLLSRNFNKNDKSPEIEDLNEFIHSVNVTDERLESLKKSLNNDKCLSELNQMIINGWPKNNSALSVDLKFYWKNRNNIFIDDLLFLNKRLIIPQELRPEILLQLHSSHLGIEKTKKRARSLVYWPQIDTDIENIISKCLTCRKYRCSN